MESYNRADILELVGIYILSRLSTIMDEIDYGIYKEDSLLNLCNVDKKQRDLISKNVIRLFKSIGFVGRYQN